MCVCNTPYRHLRLIGGQNNILVDVNGRAVVADFGLSFRISEHTGSYPVTAAARWMAPELAMDDSTPST